MKTNKILFLFAVATMLCSCAKEFATPEVQNRGEGTLTLNVNLDENVRTSLGEKEGTTYPLTWSEGDCLVIDGVVSNSLTSADAGKKTANFSFTGDFDAPYNLVYGGVADKKDVAEFKQVQPYVAGTFAPFTAPMYGTGNDLNGIVMKPLAAALRIPLTGEGSITKIIVEAEGGEALSGEFQLVRSGGVLTGEMTAPVGASVTTEVDCGDGVGLSANEVSFFVSIPAGNYTKGLKVYAVDADKKAMVLTIGGLTNAVAGKVYSLPAKAFTAGDTYVIATAEDLISILPTLVNANGTGKTAVIVNDIDMVGKEWISFGSGSSTTGNGNFSATLNGLGHTVSGLTTPLFGNLAGVLKNLTVVANVVYDANLTNYKGSTYGFGIIAGYLTDQAAYSTGAGVYNVTTKGTVTVAKTIGNNFNFGGFVGANNGGVITGCVNKADVVMNGQLSSGNFTMGGICGISQSGKGSGTFYNNVNYGDVTVNGAAVAGYIYAGGVVGRITNNKADAISLVNYGTFTATSKCQAKTSPYYGGVCGYLAPDINIKDCANYGDIHFAASLYNKASQGNYVGGVIGRTDSNKGANNLYNGGDIYIEPGFSYGYCAIGGVIAHVKDLSSFEKLVNNGSLIATTPILSTSGSWARIGGVIGHIEGIAGTVSLAHSTNRGDLDFQNAKGSSTVVVGGIAGNIKANTFVGTANTNHGDITFDGTTSGSGGIQLAGLYSRIEVNGTNKLTVTLTGEEGVITNTGNITLVDEGALNYGPICGGVLGTIFAAKDNGGEFNGTNLSNGGTIKRTVKDYTYDKESYTYDKNYHMAGGIVGNISTYTAGTLANCVNYAEVQFDKKPANGKAISDVSQISGYMGGVVGRISADNGYTVKCCKNYGDVPVIEGYAGGIAGYLWNATITGEKGDFCVNTGNVAYVPAELSRYPQATAGGILGGGSTGVSVKWCYNTGGVSGNGGISGLVGRVNNTDAKMTIQNCKTNNVNYCVSAWRKCGFVCGFTNGQESAEALLVNVKNVAVGGKYFYGTATSADQFKTLGAEDYVNHLYYNKVTAPADAQKSSAATSVITVDQAVNTYGITLWDGASTLAWEQ